MFKNSLQQFRQRCDVRPPRSRRGISMPQQRFNRPQPGSRHTTPSRRFTIHTAFSSMSSNWMTNPVSMCVHANAHTRYQYTLSLLWFAVYEYIKSNCLRGCFRTPLISAILINGNFSHLIAINGKFSNFTLEFINNACILLSNQINSLPYGLIYPL